MTINLNKGDYVLATKYSDGDPQDQWCVGFVSDVDGGRIFVEDNDGKQFRQNGFRRAECITSREGQILLAMEHTQSLWHELEDIRMKSTQQPVTFESRYQGENRCHRIGCPQPVEITLPDFTEIERTLARKMESLQMPQPAVIPAYNGSCRADEVSERFNGLNFHGPGFYITSTETLLVTCPDRPTDRRWAGRTKRDERVAYYVWSCPIEETIFGGPTLPPTREDTR